MYERFHLKSVSHGTYLVKERDTANLMTGPGPGHEPPLVMCAAVSTSIPCSTPSKICVPNTSGSIIRVEFPNGSFGFLWGTTGRPTIQVLRSPAQPSWFVVASNLSGQTRMISMASQNWMFQAGSTPSGVLQPIFVVPPANVSSQIFNIVKLP